MDEKTYAVSQMVKFLSKEASNGSYSSSMCEGLDVARECLESAYSIKVEDVNKLPEVDIIKAIWKLKPRKIPTESEKKMAETLKNQGNMCLTENLIDEAIECYSKAIEIVEDSAVYYCNRAAAYTHLGEHDKALTDCRKAIEIDPNYSKAYGRMGLVYSNQGDFQRAADSYRRALECDPGNDSYQQNLQLSQSRLAASGGAARAGGTSSTDGASGEVRASASVGASGQLPFAVPGGIDLGSVMNNPMFMNMATQVMSDPGMRTHLNNMMQMFITPQGGAGTNTASTPDAQTSTSNAAPSVPPAGPTPVAPDMDTLLRMGEQFAEQMRNTNPQLVEQLRGRYQQADDSGEPRGDDAADPSP